MKRGVIRLSTTRTVGRTVCHGATWVADVRCPAAITVDIPRCARRPGYGEAAGHSRRAGCRIRNSGMSSRDRRKQRGTSDPSNRRKLPVTPPDDEDGGQDEASTLLHPKVAAAS